MNYEKAVDLSMSSSKSDQLFYARGFMLADFECKHGNIGKGDCGCWQ